MNITDLEHLESISEEASVMGGTAIAKATLKLFALGSRYSDIEAITTTYADVSLLIKSDPKLGPLVSTSHTAASQSYINGSAE